MSVLNDIEENVDNFNDFSEKKGFVYEGMETSKITNQEMMEKLTYTKYLKFKKHKIEILDKEKFKIIFNSRDYITKDLKPRRSNLMGVLIRLLTL